MKKSIGSILAWITVAPVVYGNPKSPPGVFSIKDPQEGLFSADSKVVEGFYTAEWMVKGGAGLFAIICFIGAGNAARQGHYGRAAGAVIGGVISSLGAYLVSLSQG